MPPVKSLFSSALALSKAPRFRGKRFHTLKIHIAELEFGPLVAQKFRMYLIR